MVDVLTLTCPVCSAPLKPGEERCDYCGSYVFIRPNLPRLDLHNLNHGLIQERIDQFRGRMRKDQYDVEARYGLGLAYFNLGLTDDAVTQLKDAARLTPENPDIQTQLAVVLLKAYEDGEKAVKPELERRIALAQVLVPDNLDALFVQARFARLEGRLQDEIDLLEKLYPQHPEAVGPELVDALKALGDRQQDQRQWDGLQSTWIRLGQINPEAVAPLILRFLQRWERLVPMSVTVKRDVSRSVRLPVAPEPEPRRPQDSGTSFEHETRVIPAASAGRRLVNAFLSAIGWLIIAFILFALVTSIMPSSGVATVMALLFVAAPFVGAIRSWRRWSHPRAVAVKRPTAPKTRSTTNRSQMASRTENRTEMKDVRVSKKELLSGSEGLDALQVAAGQTIRIIAGQEAKEANHGARQDGVDQTK